MSKIDVCQGCYRVMLYENSNNIVVSVDGNDNKVNFCLQCSCNLSEFRNKLTGKDIVMYSKLCRQVLYFFDPLAHSNKICKCANCGMPTMNYRCFECSWKMTRNLMKKIFCRDLYDIVFAYADLDEQYCGSNKTRNIAYISKRINN